MELVVALVGMLLIFLFWWGVLALLKHLYSTLAVASHVHRNATAATAVLNAYGVRR